MNMNINIKKIQQIKMYNLCKKFSYQQYITFILYEFVCVHTFVHIIQSIEEDKKKTHIVTGNNNKKNLVIEKR